MGIPLVEVTELEALVAGGASLIDVREVDEYLAAHVPGAVNIPLSEFADRVDELPEGDLLMICHLGGRSMKAAEFLGQSGRAASNVVGGTSAWIDAGFDTVAGPQPV